MRFRQCSSCVSRLNFHTQARQAVAIPQSPSRRLPSPPNSFAAELSRPASTTEQRIEQRSSELCTPRTQTFTTSANKRYATILNEYHCVSYAVNLILETSTECTHSARVRTDTTLDQDCVLETTVQVCAACMIVLLLTTCMNFHN